MTSLLEILRNTEEDGALAPLGASPGGLDPACVASLEAYAIENDGERCESCRRVYDIDAMERTADDCYVCKPCAKELRAAGMVECEHPADYDGGLSDDETNRCTHDECDCQCYRCRRQDTGLLEGHDRDCHNDRGCVERCPLRTEPTVSKHAAERERMMAVLAVTLAEMVPADCEPVAWLTSTGNAKRALADLDAFTGTFIRVADEYWNSLVEARDFHCRRANEAHRQLNAARMAKPAAGGTSSLKDLATRNALIRVLEEVGRCDCRDTSVKQHNDLIKEIAEKAYYETVGRGGEDDGGGALADARVPAAQEARP